MSEDGGRQVEGDEGVKGHLAFLRLLTKMIHDELERSTPSETLAKQTYNYGTGRAGRPSK